MKCRKIMIMMAFSIIVLFGGLVMQSYAVNETNETNTSNEKSNNANLNNLGIRPHDFTGFKYETTSYEITVPEDTESVEVYAKTQHAKAKVTGTGKKKLDKGENRLDVIVTAEDGTEKTYTMHVIRGKAQESSNNSTQSDDLQNANGLLELKINDLTLLPEFKTNVYEYQVKYIGEATKLNIETKVTNENYIVEVIGNENLQEGENIITILVSDKNEQNIATYQVIVEKSLIDEEVIAKEKKQKENQVIIIGAIAVIVLIAIMIFIIIKHRRDEMQEEFFEEDDFEEDEEDNELPKALKEKSEEEMEVENMSKDQIKEKFLSNYSNYEEEYEKGRSNKRGNKHKGKRFK